jgi:hypothetical protein
MRLLRIAICPAHPWPLIAFSASAKSIPCDHNSVSDPIAAQPLNDARLAESQFQDADGPVPCRSSLMQMHRSSSRPGSVAQQPAGVWPN